MPTACCSMLQLCNFKHWEQMQCKRRWRRGTIFVLPIQIRRRSTYIYVYVYICIYNGSCCYLLKRCPIAFLSFPLRVKAATGIPWMDWSLQQLLESLGQFLSFVFQILAQFKQTRVIYLSRVDWTYVICHLFPLLPSVCLNKDAYGTHPSITGIPSCWA